MHYTGDWEKEWLRNRRVAHRDVLQRYLARNASEGFAAFEDAEASLAVANDAIRFNKYLRAIEPARLEKVITALEVYEGEFALDSIVPMSTVLLNIMPGIPDRPRGMTDFMDARIVVARVVLRALRQLSTPEAIETAANEILPKLTSLSSRAELIRIVGYQEGAGHRLVSEESASAYEKELAGLVEKAEPAQLTAESDLLRLLLAAQHTNGTSPLHAASLSPELTGAVLRSATSEIKSRSFGNRAIRRKQRLAWDAITAIPRFGNTSHWFRLN
jgi:hypothetical protein